jgi:hypothetical protein
MRKLCVFTVFVVALLLASMASTARAAPVVSHFHDSFSDTFADAQCGIDGTSVVNGVANIQILADDTFRSELRLSQVFTSTTTGKSVSIFVAAQFVAAGPAIDNGDGTVTFTESFKGLSEKIKLANGMVLSRDAGFYLINDTFDATTGDFLGETISPENGPHPDLDSGGALYCDAIIPALS